MKTAAVFLLFLAGTWAHLCMISPPQRGSMGGLNKPASNDCMLTKAPCGGRDHPENPIGLGAGEVFKVTIQKNLDHFTKDNPGHFSVSISNRTHFTELYKTPDTADGSLHLYTMNVTIPKEHLGRMVLEAKYVTNNPKAPSAFYQCADVNILPGPPGPQ